MLQCTNKYTEFGQLIIRKNGKSLKLLPPYGTFESYNAPNSVSVRLFHCSRTIGQTDVSRVRSDGVCHIGVLWNSSITGPAVYTQEASTVRFCSKSPTE